MFSTPGYKDAGLEQLIMDTKLLFNLSDSDMFAVRYVTGTDKKTSEGVKIGFSSFILCYQQDLNEKYNATTGELNYRGKSGKNYQLKLWNQVKVDKDLDPWMEQIRKVQGSQFKWQQTINDGVTLWEPIRLITGNPQEPEPQYMHHINPEQEARKHKQQEYKKKVLGLLMSSGNDDQLAQAMKSIQDNNNLMEYDSEEKSNGLDDSGLTGFQHQNLIAEYQRSIITTPPKSRNQANTNKVSSSTGNQKSSPMDISPKKKPELQKRNVEVNQDQKVYYEQQMALMQQKMQEMQMEMMQLQQLHPDPQQNISGLSQSSQSASFQYPQTDEAKLGLLRTLIQSMPIDVRNQFVLENVHTPSQSPASVLSGIGSQGDNDTNLYMKNILDSKIDQALLQTPEPTSKKRPLPATIGHVPIKGSQSRSTNQQMPIPTTYMMKQQQHQSVRTENTLSLDLQQRIRAAESPPALKLNIPPVPEHLKRPLAGIQENENEQNDSAFK